MFCIGNFLLQIFTLEGFVKACPVVLTDYYKTYEFWFCTQIQRGFVGISQADRAGLDKALKAKGENLE